MDILKIDFNDFDAIFIAGGKKFINIYILTLINIIKGLPSSTALRNSNIPKKLYKFWKN